MTLLMLFHSRRVVWHVVDVRPTWKRGDDEEWLYIWAVNNDC